jgi:hypothetical protein
VKILEKTLLLKKCYSLWVWMAKKAILHREHPTVVGSEERRPLCPPDTGTNGLLHNSSDPVKTQFTFMLGKFFF